MSEVLSCLVRGLRYKKTPLRKEVNLSAYLQCLKFQIGYIGSLHDYPFQLLIVHTSTLLESNLSYYGNERG